MHLLQYMMYNTWKLHHHYAHFSNSILSYIDKNLGEFSEIITGLIIYYDHCFFLKYRWDFFAVRGLLWFQKNFRIVFSTFVTNAFGILTGIAKTGDRSGCSIDWIIFHPDQWRVRQWKLSLRGNLHWAGMSDTLVLTVVILGKAWQQLRGSMAAPSSRWRIQRGWVSTILPPADLRNIFLWLPRGVKFSNIFVFWRKKKKDKNIDECRF